VPGGRRHATAVGAGPLVCPTCGTPTVPGARFCHVCGTPLAQSAGEPAERRMVTVLFGDLSDFTSWAEDLDPERVGLVTDRVLAACSTAVSDVGGHVDKLTGDGIMAVFGAPTAHEDDPVRAVRAAAAMQLVATRLVAAESGGGRRLGLRVGINTGEVLAGVQGGQTYTVVGDAVNTAARLSDAAGAGSVIAGRETALATVASASWRALQPLRLKGKRELVPAYELVGLRSAPGPRFQSGEEAPLVGRDAERGVLIGRLLDALAGERPLTTLVTGDAGIGKTRLAAELARFAGELAGARVLWGHCAPYGVGRDLSPIAELVRTALGVGPRVEEDPAEAVQQVLRAIGRLEHPAAGSGRLSAGVADRLRGLLGLTDEPASVLGALPDRGGRLAAELEAVAELLSSLAASGPLLLVIDDLQWATDSTLTAIAVVAAALRGPVLLLGLGRGELLSRGRWTRRLPGVEALPLVPLEEVAAERLLRAYLGGAEVEPQARRRLLDRAQGNPFFLGELLHLLVDRGVLVPGEEGSWDLVGELPDDVLPAGVQAVVAARIDGLEAGPKAVLRDAAVLGARVPEAGLVALAGGSVAAAGRVARAVEALSGRQMLQPAPGESGRRPRTWVFVHALVRDVAYASVPKADRAHRHAAAARWAGTALPPGPETDQVVAIHAAQAARLAAEMALPAGDPAWSVRALGFAASLRLGQAALARDDPRAAERLLARAVQLGRSVATTAEVLTVEVALAASHAALWQLEAAEQTLAAALRQPGGAARAAALVVLGDVRRKQGREDAATEAWVGALAVASEAGLEPVAGEALRNLGLQLYYRGRLRAAEQRFAEALELSRRVGDARGAGWALQHLAWSATTRGAWGAAEAALHEAASVFRDLDDGGLAWVSGTEAFVRALQGRFAETRRLLATLLPAAEERGDRWAVAACLTVDALATAELGSTDVAVRAATRAADLFVSLHDSWGRSLALVAHGIAMREAGRPGEAATLLERAVAVGGEGANTAAVALALVVLAHTLLDDGDLDRAARFAEQALGSLASIDLEPGATVGVRVLEARLRRGAGDLDGALAILERAADVARGGGLLFPERLVLALQADVLLDLGRVADGLALAVRADDTPAEDVRSRAAATAVLLRARSLVG